MLLVTATVEYAAGGWWTSRYYMWLLKRLGYQFHKLQKIVYADTVSNVWLSSALNVTLGNEDSEVEVVGSEV